VAYLCYWNNIRIPFLATFISIPQDATQNTLPRSTTHPEPLANLKAMPMPNASSDIIVLPTATHFHTLLEDLGWRRGRR